MKKGLLIAAMITVLSVTANAQAKNKDRLATLQLTTEQKSSVDSAKKVYDAKRAALKKDANASEETKTEKLKEIRKEQITSINSLLKKEQKQQLKKNSKKKGKKDNE